MNEDMDPASLQRKCSAGRTDTLPSAESAQTPEEFAAWAKECGLLKEGERLDDLQRSNLRIIQDPGRFCFGMDAVLLSDYAAAAAGDRVLDLGTGTGILPLLLSARTQAGHITGLEIQHESADMASRSVRLNALEERIDIVEGDIREADAIFAPASYDVITCNPPYIPPNSGRVNPQDAKALARHEILCTFADVARVSGRILKPGGHLFLVHRPYRLPELMRELALNHLEPKRLRLCYPRADQEADLLLLECVRGARPRLVIEKPLIIWNQDGTYTEEIRQLYGF